MSKIILFAGKKSSGKSSAANYTFKSLANSVDKINRFSINKNGYLVDILEGKTYTLGTPSEENKKLYDSYGIKVYNFADSLKEIVHNMFGIDYNILYGNDIRKNMITHLLWEDMPYQLEKRRFAKGVTTRELLQVFGTEVFRKLDPHCHARSTYDKINREDYDVAIVGDARFYEEITLGTERGATAIKLLRQPFVEDKHSSEKKIDGIPGGEFNFHINNNNLSLDEKNNELEKAISNVKTWYKSNFIEIV